MAQSTKTQDVENDNNNELYGLGLTVFDQDDFEKGKNVNCLIMLLLICMYIFL